MQLLDFVKQYYPARIKAAGLLDDFESKFVRIVDDTRKVVVGDYFTAHIKAWLDEHGITLNSPINVDRVEIVINGPTGVGKSVVMAAIANMLKEQFNVEVISPDLVIERKLTMPDTPADWELARIKATEWVLCERQVSGTAMYNPEYTLI